MGTTKKIKIKQPKRQKDKGKEATAKTMQRNKHTHTSDKSKTRNTKSHQGSNHQLTTSSIISLFSLSLSLSQPQWLNFWLRAVEVPVNTGGCFQEHHVVLTICGASYIGPRNVGQLAMAGLGARGSLLKRASLRALAAYCTTSVLKIRVEAHGLTTNSSL